MFVADVLLCVGLVWIREVVCLWADVLLCVGLVWLHEVVCLWADVLWCVGLVWIHEVIASLDCRAVSSGRRSAGLYSQVSITAGRRYGV